MARQVRHDPLLTPAEVATIFRVDPITVGRWAKAGRLTSVRTPGGHRRYYAAEVQELLDGSRTARRDTAAARVRAIGGAS